MHKTLLARCRPLPPAWPVLHALIVALGASLPVYGAAFPTPQLSEISPGGIDGSLVLCGGGQIPAAIVSQFLELAGGEAAHLVVIPTATDRSAEGQLDSFAQTWRERGFKTVEVIHTHDRRLADSEQFVAPLRAATAVWFVGGQQSRLAAAYVGTRVERELDALLERGGVIGGTSAGAAIQCRLMIAGGNPEAKLMQGLDLVPGGVIDQHFKARERRPRLTAVLQQHRGYFGLGIDERTGIVVRGRRITVWGDSTVTVCLSASPNRPPLHYELTSGDTADLTALRRAAISRAAPTFPAQVTPVPCVETGALMLVGGGRVSEAMWSRFVELAGGPAAHVVVVPTASANAGQAAARGEIRRLREAGAHSVTVLHTRDRAEANQNEFIEPLRQATGVWFGGGRQWRIVDAYEGTAVYAQFHDLLGRGGVIGGSSAGATIQGSYLVRGNPLGNRDMMAEGYERGFDFLPGCAVDQHFTQRGRQTDMQALKRTFPQLLGIGIDESTALVVQKMRAEVIGSSNVYFYGGSPQDDTASASFIKLSAGEAYDLERRTKRSSR